MEEKLHFFIQKLSSLPNCRNDDFYRWADYIELKCLVNKDGVYSQDDFIDDAKPRAEDLGEGDFEDNEIDKKLSNAQKNDKWEEIAGDTFQVIENRIVIFGDSYPFYLTSNKRAIKLKEKIETEKFYIFLLLCSDLKYTLKFKNELTSSFEHVSKEVMGNILPNAEIHLFGSSNSEESNKEWKSTKLWDKLEWLSIFLNERLAIAKESFSDYDKGDRGLDIVAKLPLQDNLSNSPIFFAQCACSPSEWVTKQHSIQYANWSGLLMLSTDPNYFMFIPQSFRNSQGNWHHHPDIKRTILFDRFRIVKNFKNHDIFEKLSSFPIVEKLISIKESVY